MSDKLAWALMGDDGTIARVYLTMGAPRGVLQLTLPDNTTWRTEIGIDEIVLFASNVPVAIVELYLNEMVLNARAATAVLVH
jgi:hypothetical protein